MEVVSISNKSLGSVLFAATGVRGPDVRLDAVLKRWEFVTYCGFSSGSLGFDPQQAIFLKNFKQACIP